MTAIGGNAASPANEGADVNPSDTVLIDPPTRGLYVGVTGDVVVDFAQSGTDILFKAVPGGTILPISVKRVKATNTTASFIRALR